MNSFDVFKRLETIISSIGYKPNWKISVKPKMLRYSRRLKGWTEDYSTLTIRAIMVAPDTITGKSTEILSDYDFSAYTIENMKDEEIIRYVIKSAIMKLEHHEFDEWYKYKGEHVFDPHPELKNKDAA